MKRVLIANRGEIALRLIKACFDEGLESVLVVSEADKDSAAARLADRVITIGPASASESYLSIDRVVAAAKIAEADAIHPGYGFLSERPELVEACEEEGITFVGPPADVMRRAGSKLGARSVAAELGIPTGSGSSGLANLEEAVAAAEQLDNYPLLLKASAGGGGRGMTIIRDADDVRSNFQRLSNEALSAFGDGTLYFEPYIERARHVEVQILADTHGNVIHLGERDCSVQRRYQKVIEEAPSIGLNPALVERIRTAAVDLARGLNYVNAGTVEFLVDIDKESFIFLEVNARVQVEHPVSELVTGVDIVREQLRIAAGEPLSVTQEDVQISGHSIECRINAEDPYAGFQPTPGKITRWTPPVGTGIRIDSAMFEGAVIPPYYDSMIGKLIVHAEDRDGAVELMRRALTKFEIEGVKSTIDIQAAILADAEFAAGKATTKWLEDSFLPKWEGNGDQL